MATPPAAPVEVSTVWAHALAWRSERHLLDPVLSGRVADVVRRLGAVPSMDESLAELAVRTRSAPSQPGDLAAALVDGTVIKVFAFRGAVHYPAPEDGGVHLALRAAGRRWELCTYGPATADHVHHWLGAGLGAGRRRLDRWLAALADDLEAASPTESARLLPGHDQWVMGVGIKDEHVVPPSRRDPVNRKANLDEPRR